MDDIMKNPHRRKILEILYSKKVATPNELAQALGIGTPAVYYHLDLMKEYVYKTSRGEFGVTEKGISLYREMMRENLYARMPVSRVAPYLRLFEPRLLAWLLIPAGILAATTEAFLCQTFGFRPYFFGYAPSAAGQYSPMLLLIGTLALLFFILEGFSFGVTRRAGGEKALLAGVLISRLPLLLIIAANLYPSPLSAIAFSVGPLLSLAILALFLSISKGIRPEIAIIICFITFYLDITVYSLT